MKIRALFHNPLGEHGVGKWIVRWTWLLALFYSVPKLFKKPRKGMTRWQEFKKALSYNFSHEEKWIPRIYNLPPLVSFSTRDLDNNLIYLGQCFSSTTRGDANGVRFAPANKVLKHPERWSYIEFEVDPERLEVALEEAKKLVGQKYDFWALFGFFHPFPVQDSKRWYCSEICNWFRVLCGISWYEKRISPRRSAYLLAKKYGEPIPLVRPK